MNEQVTTGPEAGNSADPGIVPVANTADQVREKLAVVHADVAELFGDVLVASPRKAKAISLLKAAFDIADQSIANYGIRVPVEDDDGEPEADRTRV